MERSEKDDDEEGEEEDDDVEKAHINEQTNKCTDDTQSHTKYDGMPSAACNWTGARQSFLIIINFTITLSRRNIFLGTFGTWTNTIWQKLNVLYSLYSYTSNGSFPFYLHINTCTDRQTDRQKV